MNANVNVSKEHRIGLKSVNKMYGTFNFIFQHTDVQICNRTRLCTYAKIKLTAIFLNGLYSGTSPSGHLTNKVTEPEVPL